MKKFLLILILLFISTSVFAEPRWCTAVRWQYKDCLKTVEKRKQVHEKHCASRPEEFQAECLEIADFTEDFGTNICSVDFTKGIVYCYKKKSSRKKKKVYYEEHIGTEDSVQ